MALPHSYVRGAPATAPRLVQSPMAPLPRALAALLLAAVAAATTGDEVRLEFKHADGTVANAIESTAGSLEIQISG